MIVDALKWERWGGTMMYRYVTVYEVKLPGQNLVAQAILSVASYIPFAKDVSITFHCMAQS